MRFFTSSRSILIGFVATCVVSGCRESSTSPLPDDSANTGPSGPARLIAAKGTLLRLGSDDPQAAPEERPGWTRFAHDFWMDTTEVTQKEFAALAGRNPSLVKGDNLPVTNVTWFDAVLAANARSRRDGLDTVYRYFELKINPDGSVWDLAGLSTDLTRGGWRLPTEAEWELAARGGTSTPWPWGDLADSSQARKYAWYQPNSGNAIHDVSTLLPNALGLHDMQGNVMEWVGDWKGSYPDSAVDYAGQNSPSAVGDKPVKGGSYGFGLRNLRPSSRSSTYASLPSSSTEYVGFRLARGGIPLPRYGLPGGATQVALPPVTWNPAPIKAQFGFRSAKIVFVQVGEGRRFLSWIDFGSAAPVLRQFPQDDAVFHPVISPDGNWVAWSTVLEGSRQEGKIRLRNLSSTSSQVLEWSGTGAIPRWWVRPGSRDTFLVVGSSAMDNTSPDWERQTTRLVGFSGGRFTSDSILTSRGAYHDGLSADGRFLATGYRRLRILDLLTGSTTVEFTGPANGKTSGDTSQMCNVSMAPDSSGDILGLDFGYSATSSVAGRPYGIHELAFRVKRNGTISAPIAAPSGTASLEDLEWTSDRAFATASVVDGQGLRKGIWVFGLNQAIAQSVVEGSDLWHPNLWIEPDAPWISAVSDSAGAYNTPSSSFAVEELANKLVRFWPLRDSIQVAAVGSSHTRFGIAPASMPTFKVFNLGAASGSYDLSDTLVMRYLLPHSPRLKYVVLELETGWMTYLKCEYVCEWFEATIGRRFDRNHSVWKDSLPERILSRITQRTWGSSGLYSAWGQFDAPTVGWGQEATPCWVDHSVDANFTVYKRNTKALEKLLDTLDSRGIKVLGVVFPQSPRFKETEYAGRYEPRWPLYRTILAQIKSLESSHRNFRLYDAFQDGNHDYSDSEAYDNDHLSARGAAKLSPRIDSILSDWK
jgi:uncharacterized protein (TIGR02171 family)